jgi:hypothetical protein
VTIRLDVAAIVLDDNSLNLEAKAILPSVLLRSLPTFQRAERLGRASAREVVPTAKPRATSDRGWKRGRARCVRPRPRG